jgi:benzylsuccinate CoA-transferase BbsE subunit
MTASNSPGPLDGLRILEVPGPLAAYTGKLLADSGADVVLIEPPDGVSTRAAAPLSQRDGRSLSFAYFNTSKRSVVLDLDHDADRDAFLTLADSADAILDGTGRLGWLTSRGLGSDAVLARNPRLVYTVVTPFGVDGPWAEFAATDTTLMALGGFLSLGGYYDGPPVRAFGDQGLLAAAQFAGVATLLAILSAEQTGAGQLVDVSVQQSVVMANENAVQTYDLEHVVRRRNGGDPRQAGVGIYECADGHVYLLTKGLGLFWAPMVDWLVAEGVERAETLHDPKWDTPDYPVSREGKQEFLDIAGGFLTSHTKAELYDAARRIRIPLCPVNNTADLAASEHLKARGYFVTVGEGAAMLTIPGAPFQLADSPSQVRAPAPEIGQHTAELLGQQPLTRTGGR